MKRRDFIKQSCGSCAAISISLLLGSGFLESCGSSKIAVLKTKATEGKVIVPLNDFKPNDVKLIRVDGYPFDIALKMQESQTFLALVMMCSHAGHPLVKSGSGYYCTLHGSRFNGDGTVGTGPASKPLLHLPTKIVNDTLELTLIQPTFS